MIFIYLGAWIYALYLVWPTLWSMNSALVMTLLVALTIPPISLHLNYIRRAQGSTLVISPDQITLKTLFGEKSLLTTNLQQIEIFSPNNHVLNPWNNFCYFRVFDSKNEMIEFNCYLISLEQLQSVPAIAALFKEDHFKVHGKILPYQPKLLR